MNKLLFLLCFVPIVFFGVFDGNDSKAPSDWHFVEKAGEAFLKAKYHAPDARFRFVSKSLTENGDYKFTLEMTRRLNDSYVMKTEHHMLGSVSAGEGIATECPPGDPDY